MISRQSMPKDQTSVLWETEGDSDSGSPLVFTTSSYACQRTGPSKCMVELEVLSCASEICMTQSQFGLSYSKEVKYAHCH